MLNEREARSSPPALLPRAATGWIERMMKVVPVVVLMGARQTGKSTLARQIAVDGRAADRRQVRFLLGPRTVLLSEG